MHRWPMVPLGEVLIERTERPTIDELIADEVPVVSKISFDTGRINLRPDVESKTGLILAQPGDLLVSGINAAKGAIAVHSTDADGPIAATIHYGAYHVRPEKADTEFLWWLLRSSTFRDLLYDHVPGGIKTELKAKRLFKVPVPLPPVTEQRRLAAHIDALAAKIALAQKMREDAIQERLQLGSAATNIFAANIWPMITMEELVGRENLRNGISVKSTEGPDNVFCLTLASIRLGQIDCSERKPIPLSLTEANPYLIEQGDVFIVRGNGSKDLVGKAGFVSTSLPRTVFPDLFIRVPLPLNRIEPEYFVAAWNSGSVRRSIEDRAKTTSGIWKINQGHICETILPLPPIEEQRRIIAYLNTLSAKTEALKKLQAATAAQLDALLPSLLDQAFKGQLQ